MTQAHLVASLTDDVVLAAFFGALFFVASYTVVTCKAGTPWWRHAIGTTLVLLDSGLVLALTPAVLHRMLGLSLASSLAFSWYYLGSLTLIAAATWWRSWVMLRINWRSRRKGGR